MSEAEVVVVAAIDCCPLLLRAVLRRSVLSAWPIQRDSEGRGSAGRSDQYM